MGRSTYLNFNKSELIDIILEMEDKLSEVRHVEDAQKATISELPFVAIGALPNENGEFCLVKVAFDTKLGAQVKSIDNLNTKDQQILSYHAMKVLGNIVRKAAGDKYVDEI